MKATTFILAALVALASCASAATVGSVTIDKDGALKFEPKIVSGAVAVGSYTDQEENAHASGFGQLSIKTTAVAGVSDADQLRAAGYLEGALTHVRMAQQYANFIDWFKGNFANHSLPPAFKPWFEKQDAWVRGQVEGNRGEPRWEMMNLLVHQLDGLVEGYNSQAPTKASLFEWQLTNAVGDLLDLIPAINDENAPDWEHWPKEKVLAAIRERGHCSALIKVTGDLSDLLMSHVAWFTYQSMLRIHKSYDFDVPVAGRRSVFSSYPGVLSSVDDFYINGPSQLGMVQTTNNVFNKALYELVKPESLWAWQRVRAANALASKGSEWVEVIRADNSGTYNNAYMVVDFKLFTPGKALRPDTLWYSEQIPGMVVGEDVTKVLERGYWPSYNVPYFPEVYNASGYPSMVERLGADVQGLDYQLAPRAQLFRRDNGKVVDIHTLQDLMRANNYKTDPYAHDDPWDAICSRGDLAAKPSLGGCYDGKTTSAAMVPDLRAFMVNGPTTSNGSLPPFRWEPSMNATIHEGQFEVFDFSWQEMAPAAL